MNPEIDAMYEKIRLHRLKTTELEERRKQILKLPLEKRIRAFQQTLELNLDLKEEDEEKVKQILEKIGEREYAHTEHEYKIFETEEEERVMQRGWSWLSLRWPAECYVDEFMIYRDLVEGESLFFANLYRSYADLRGKKREALVKKAQGIYEEIRAGLSKS